MTAPSSTRLDPAIRRQHHGGRTQSDAGDDQQDDDAVTSMLRPATDTAHLVERLSMIDPFALDTHPIGQMDQCERSAQQIAAASEMSLHAGQVASVVDAYAYGLKDGFYGLGATIIRDGADEQIHSGDLTAIALAGLRHGRALRAWWSDHRDQLQEAFCRSGPPE